MAGWLDKCMNELVELLDDVSKLCIQMGFPWLYIHSSTHITSPIDYHPSHTDAKRKIPRIPAYRIVSPSSGGIR